MTAKQKRFCEEYLIDLNATQAAIRAGYAPASAADSGSDNMQNREVSAYIKKQMAQRSRRTGVTADRVLEELAKVAFANATDLIDDDGTIKDNVAREDSAAIATIKVKTIRSRDGEEAVVEREVRMADKIKALELCGKHIGMFGVGEDETVPISFVVKYDYGESDRGGSTV